MPKSYTHFATNAELHIGDENLIKNNGNDGMLGLFTFIWSQEEQVSLFVDGEPITLPPNSILSLTPVQRVAYEGYNPLIAYQFNREFYCIKDHDKEVGCVGLLFFGNDQVPLIQLEPTETKKFKQLHQVILDELDEVKDNMQAEMLRMLIARFIIKTTRILKTKQGATLSRDVKFETLRKYNLLVDTHFREEHSVSFYADLLNKSPKTLSNSFAKLGKSPVKIIHERVILEAKRMLLYTEKSAKEIAFEIGFEDPSHLSRMFKRHTGISPSAFKSKSQATI